MTTLTNRGDPIAPAMRPNEVTVWNAVLSNAVQPCGSIAVMDSGLVAIHEGKGFRFCYYHSVLAAAATFDILWVAGANPPHATSALSVSGSARIQVYDRVTTATDGTAIPIYNLNLAYLALPVTTAFYSPTGVVLGTRLIRDEYIPGGTTGTRVGSASRDNTELVLAPNTKLLVRITNLASGDIAFSYTGNFYEE